MGKLYESMQQQKKVVVTCFGAPLIVIAKTWELIAENNDENDPKIRNKEHLLWALHYLKNYPNFAVMCKTMMKKSSFIKGSTPCTEKTLRQWVRFYIHEVRALECIVIIWDNRKQNGVLMQEGTSVDSTDVPYAQIRIPDPENPGKTIINKALYSFKLEGPGLRYQLAVSLLTNDIVSVDGPFCPGDWNDLEIFRHTLKDMLEPGERMVGDDIYVGESPRYIVCPASCTTGKESIPLLKRIEGRHESVNKHVKNWACLTRPFRSRGSAQEMLETHSDMFRACCVSSKSQCRWVLVNYMTLLSSLNIF